MDIVNPFLYVHVQTEICARLCVCARGRKIDHGVLVLLSNEALRPKSLSTHVALSNLVIMHPTLPWPATLARDGFIYRMYNYIHVYVGICIIRNGVM